MGLAEPRKRMKISHDPRNTTWTNSENSYGQRLMQQQGWKAGEALGANGKSRKYADTEAAKVNVKYKDDTLGLGASLKSRDIASQRTGFDAFQGLLGRLNARTEEEVQAVEKKLEDKKLAMFAQGRWGGMLFVPGGLLVQSDPYKQIEALKNAKKQEQAEAQQDKTTDATNSKEEKELPKDVAENAELKTEKKQRKEERRQRKEVKRLKQEAQLNQRKDELDLPTPDPSSANEAPPLDHSRKGSKSKKREQPSEAGRNQKADRIPVVAVQQNLRNGRHLLRGKNIQAKRMAFSDMKGLDEIFMKVG